MKALADTVSLPQVTTVGATMAASAEVPYNTSSCIAESASLYLSMLSYLVNVKPQPAVEPEYDFVIVGGGTAGCVLASRLSEVSDWRVLLLEAGGEEPKAAFIPGFSPLLWTSSLDWGYTTVPDQRSCGGRGCHWPRARVLGGCSTVNHMVYARGNKADFDHWQDLGNLGWSYDHVLEHFKKFEDNHDHRDVDLSLHGEGGPLRIERMEYYDVNVEAMVEAFKELGFREGDVNGFRQEGTVTRAQTFSFNGRRQSASTAFLEPVRYARRNLHVLTGATVTRLLLDSDRVVAVEYTAGDTDTVSTVRVGRECILSAGAINTPQILMLSGIGPREVLEPLGIEVRQDLQVGQNLQDHVATSGVRFVLNATSQLRCAERGADYRKYRRLSRGPLAAIGVTQATAFGKSHYLGEHINYVAPTIQYMFDGITSISPSRATLPSASSYYNQVWVRTILMHPISQGYISIASSDPYAKPLIHPNYFSQRGDVDVLIQSLQYATTLVSTKSLRDLGYTLDTQPLDGCENFTFNSTSYWECVLQEYTQTIYHPVGTCKMGPANDPQAVVDPQLKVYGTQNLRVIDASIMPTITTGNTEAPILMIAEKGADMIKSAWKPECNND